MAELQCVKCDVRTVEQYEREGTALYPSDGWLAIGGMYGGYVNPCDEHEALWKRYISELRALVSSEAEKS